TGSQVIAPIQAEAEESPSGLRSTVEVEERSEAVGGGHTAQGWPRSSARPPVWIVPSSNAGPEPPPDLVRHPFNYPNVGAFDLPMTRNPTNDDEDVDFVGDAQPGEVLPAEAQDLLAAAPDQVAL